MTRTLEVERKFEVDEPFVPDLSPVARVGEPSEHLLRATYTDTPGLDLTAAGWSLRRRVGGPDAGWHLKRPAAADARLEVQLPPSHRLPPELEAEAREVAGRAPLVPMARVESVRTTWPVVVAGEEVAVLSRDHVTASAGGRTEVWTEAEIELTTDADPGLLASLADAMLAGGARPAPHASKAVRAFALLTPFVAPEVSEAPAGAVLRAFLHRQVGVLQAMEGGVRTDEPDAVHKMRVATRRLRSALRSFSRLLDPDRVDLVRAELRWLGEMLGRPRDAEVQLEEFAAMLDELGEAATSTARARLLGHLERRHDEGLDALVEALAGPRADRLRQSLADIVVDPPLRRRAGRPADRTLPKQVAAMVRRVERLAAHAAERPDRLERWHEVRKAAKAARYSHEAVADALGEEYVERARAWEDVTESFGALQDTAVGLELMEQLLEEAEQAGESPEPYLLLEKRLSEKGERSLAEGRRALEKALAASTG